jgi:hypothetical protein
MVIAPAIPAHQPSLNQAFEDRASHMAGIVG